MVKISYLSSLLFVEPWYYYSRAMYIFASPTSPSYLLYIQQLHSRLEILFSHNLRICNETYFKHNEIQIIRALGLVVIISNLFAFVQVYVHIYTQRVLLLVLVVSRRSRRCRRICSLPSPYSNHSHRLQTLAGTQQAWH